MSRNTKPLNVLIEKEDEHYVQRWIDKGHHIILMDYDDSVDIIVSPKARLINPASEFLSLESQLDVIEKSARACKYPKKEKNKIV